ncbi:MAG: HupE/UreJ family protein [Myxococcota bacterium]
MKRVSFLALAGLTLLGSAAVPKQARGHDTSVTVVELAEARPGRFTVRITAARAMSNERPKPVFPGHCTFDEPILDCGQEGLEGALSLEGLGAKQSAAMFRVRFASGDTQVHTVTPSEPSIEISNLGAAEGFTGVSRVFRAYLVIGIEHILMGLDHLVFVLGLIWLVRSRWRLVKTITAFTVAHSLTLAAVTFGYVGVPERFVNALIALSIVFVAVEVVKLKRGEEGLTVHRPWVVSFAFGLLHGFGFASALTKLGFPIDRLPLALVAFNVGVEIGQIAFVLLVLLLAWSYRTMLVSWPRRAELVPVYALGAVASFWTIDRVVRLLGGAAALALLLLPAPAYAHEQVGIADGLTSGFLHPITGPDHLVAMVAVGLWGAQLGAPMIWMLPIAFPLLMSVGGVLGVMSVPVPGVEVGVALSAVVLGAVVLLAYRAPRWVAVVIVSVFAIFHGHAHGTELPSAMNPLAYGLGFVTSTGLLHLVGILIGMLQHWPKAGPMLVRACGGAVAVLGLVFLSSHLGL